MSLTLEIERGMEFVLQMTTTNSKWILLQQLYHSMAAVDTADSSDLEYTELGQFVSEV